MDKGYAKNILKKGDPGFEYDKRVEFKPPTGAVDADNSWDEGDEMEGDDAYFDDDFV